MPPVAVAVQVNGTPAACPVPQLTVTPTGCPATVTLAEPVTVPVLASRALLLIEYVPFGEQVTDMLLVVDEPVQAAGRVQVNV